MGDTSSTDASPVESFNPNIRTPEMEMAELGRGVPAAADLALEDLNPANPHLYKEDRLSLIHI